MTGMWKYLKYSLIYLHIYFFNFVCYSRRKAEIASSEFKSHTRSKNAPSLIPHHLHPQVSACLHAPFSAAATVRGKARAAPMKKHQGQRGGASFNSHLVLCVPVRVGGSWDQNVSPDFFFFFFSAADLAKTEQRSTFWLLLFFMSELGSLISTHCSCEVRLRKCQYLF